jgi:phenylacetate-CoA ligase
LAQNIKTYIGVSVTVRVGEAGSVERSMGKAQRIKDLRPKN